MSVKQGMPFVGPILHVFFIFILHLHYSWMLTFMLMTPHLLLSQGGNANKSFMEKNVNEDLEHVVNWSKMNKL